MKIFAKLVAGLALAGAIGNVHALPITDIYTPATAVTLSTGVPYIFQHDLVALGFDPLVDTLTNATLTLAISVANGQNLTIALDGVSNTNSLGAWNLAAGLAVDLASLQSDGILNVILTKGGGNGSTFSFTSSILFVDGRTALVGGRSANQPIDVPEPAMLTMLGLGLIGARLAIRRHTMNA